MSITNKNPQPHWDAQLYKDNSMKLQYRMALDLLDQEDFTGGPLRVLDIGCGDGKITKEIANRVAVGQGYALGVDLSENMIAFAKREYHDVANLSFHVMDAEDIKLDGQFDRIYSFFCLQWVPDKQKAFNEVSRLLKKGGSGTLIMSNRNQPLTQVRKELSLREEWKPYFVGYLDPTDVMDDFNYRRYMENAGLLCLHYDRFEKRVIFDDFDELKNFSIAVTPHAQQIPENLKNKFLNEMVDCFYERLKPVDGNQNYFDCEIMVANVQK